MATIRGREGNQVGRKAISGEPKSDRPLRIRLTDGERDQLDHAASRAGMTTSAWARDLLLSASARKLPARPGRKGAK